MHSPPTNYISCIAAFVWWARVHADDMDNFSVLLLPYAQPTWNKSTIQALKYTRCSVIRSQHLADLGGLSLLCCCSATILAMGAAIDLIRTSTVCVCIRHFHSRSTSIRKNEWGECGCGAKAFALMKSHGNELCVFIIFEIKLCIAHIISVSHTYKIAEPIAELYSSLFITLSS